MNQVCVKNIVIVGAGFGGITCARRLRKLLPRNIQITLLTKDNTFCYLPSLPWQLIGKRSESSITRPINSIRTPGVHIKIDEVTSIQPDSRIVHTKSGESIHCDYLIIAMGAEYEPQKIPGLVQAGFNAYSLEGVKAFTEVRSNITEGNIVLLITATPFKCPAAPYEMAMLLEDYYHRKLRLQNVSISICTPEPGPMSLAGQQVSQKLRSVLETKLIGYFPNHTIQTVNAQNKTLHFDAKPSIEFSALLYIPPHLAPKAIRDTILVNDAGWIQVDPKKLTTQFKNIFAIGDVVNIPLEVGKPLPKAGVLATDQAEVVANNIAYDLGYTRTVKEFTGYGKCFVEMGNGKAAYGKGNFYALPSPDIHLYEGGYHWHLNKILLEKMWLYRHF